MYTFSSKKRWNFSYYIAYSQKKISYFTSSKLTHKGFLETKNV